MTPLSSSLRGGAGVERHSRVARAWLAEPTLHALPHPANKKARLK